VDRVLSETAAGGIPRPVPIVRRQTRRYAHTHSYRRSVRSGVFRHGQGRAEPDLPSGEQFAVADRACEGPPGLTDRDERGVSWHKRILVVADCGLVRDPSCRCHRDAARLPFDQRQAGFPFEAHSAPLQTPGHDRCCLSCGSAIAQCAGSGQTRPAKTSWPPGTAVPPAAGTPSKCRWAPLRYGHGRSA
jgi:hypothetical protein